MSSETNSLSDKLEASGFEAVIGLEVHAQLSTDSKIFASSGTVSGRPENSLTDPTTLGLPGSLPVLNHRVVDFAIKLGLATNCTIEKLSVFSRKHYLYPDLPKGYQISQYDKPLCTKGYVEVRSKTGTKRVGLTRIHLEEDAGKNIHLEGQPFSLVDLNRAGVPLVEIVSEPDMSSPEEAGQYMRRLRQTLRHLDICDGNMEEGSLRCDANVSIRKRGVKTLGTKVEIKNLNSFRYVEKALEYEILRQVEVVSSGGSIQQETRLWDDGSQSTRTMRTKEQAADYRYFPDPDLPQLVVDESWLNRVRASLPELPNQIFDRFKKLYELEDYLCELLTEDKLTSRYFDQAVSCHNSPKNLANWITTELFGRMNKEALTMESCPVSPEDMASLVKLIDDGVISGKIAKGVFDEMFSSGVSPSQIVESKGLQQLSDPAQISAVIDAVVAANPEQLAAYRAGKTKMFAFFVGQIMKETGGKANPQLLNQLLEARLKGE